METKHTKGTWIVDEQQDSGETIIRATDGTIVANLEVDFSESHNGQRQTDEIQANAKLIAAAPELLKALEELVKTASPHFYKLGVKKAFSELLIIEEAKKAINKATT